MSKTFGILTNVLFIPYVALKFPRELKGYVNSIKKEVS